MIVLFLKDNDRFLQAIPRFPDIKEEGNKLLLKFSGYWKPIVSDLTKAGYKLYPDQRIEIPNVWDEELEDWVPKEVTVAELKLRDFTPEELSERKKLARDLYREVDDLKSKVAKLEGEKPRGGEHRNDLE